MPVIIGKEHQMSERVHHCIFCGAKGRLTREHVFPNWLKNHILRVGDHNYHWVGLKGHKPGKGKMHRPGDAHSQRLQVVCASCNSGWMSDLQNLCKTILIELLSENWTDLSQEKQSILNRWICMTVMVIEFAHLRTVEISQDQRSRFRLDQSRPAGWFAWIGRHDPEEQNPEFFNHFAWDSNGRRFQSTTFTVNRLLVHTFMSPDGCEASAFARRWGMRTVCPFVEALDKRPGAVHDFDTRHSVSEDAALAYGILPFRSQPEIS